jgi:hypothetical protein
MIPVPVRGVLNILEQFAQCGFVAFYNQSAHFIQMLQAFLHMLHIPVQTNQQPVNFIFYGG